jgi:hypothetical protein
MLGYLLFGVVNSGQKSLPTLAIAQTAQRH